MTTVMTPSDITAGQIGKLQELLGARLRKSGLQSVTVQQVLERYGDAIAEEMVAIVLQRTEALNVLKFVGTIEVVLKDDLDPLKFYRDRNGFWVYGGFSGGSITKRAKALKAGTSFKVDVHEVVAENGATDAEIETALGGKHLFDETTLSGIYAAMMVAQPNGEEGHLLSKGYANIAYVERCVARARHRGGAYAGWTIYGWGSFDNAVWDAGDRVFSPAK